MQDMHQMLQGVSGIDNVPRTTVPATAQTVAQCPPPWPTAEGLLSGELRPGALDSLPADVRGRIVGFSASSLPVHAHVSEKLRQKIWADEFVEMNTMLHDNADKPQFALSVQELNKEETSVICVAKKTSQSIGSFQRWLKAYEIFMSIYLLQPNKSEQAPKMLKYISTVRGLAERGGNWVHYGETFRALRSSQGWQWDVVHSELYLQAAQPVSSSRMAPSAFQGKARRGAGVRGERSTGVCFAFNKGQPCVQSPCPFRHLCRNCGNKHPRVKCYRNKSPLATSSAKK